MENEDHKNTASYHMSQGLILIFQVHGLVGGWLYFCFESLMAVSVGIATEKTVTTANPKRIQIKHQKDTRTTHQVMQIIELG